LVIGGVRRELDAPGLKMIRRELTTNVYWACDEADEFKAYFPRTVRIHVDLTVTEPEEVASVISTVEEVCQREQQAMLAWVDAGTPDHERLAPRYDGTLGSLIEIYRSDPESGFQRLKENTQESYEDWLQIVENTIGKRRLDRIRPKWFRSCYDQWIKPELPNGAPRVRRAYGCIQILRAIFNYGIEADVPHAKRLRDGMETLRFAKNPPREEAMTNAYSTALVETCLKQNAWRMALCQAIPWDTSLRQRDVIGQWRDEAPGYVIKPGEIKKGSRVWSGLTLDRIDVGRELVIRTSKTGQPVVHRISNCPLIMKCIPHIDRTNPLAPVALSSRGLPWNDHRAFGKAWRKYAALAGIPETVWNMDNRAGGLSEGAEGGASDDDLAAIAGHAGKNTTRRIYKRKVAQASERVQRSRERARSNGA
jgi:predicted RNase H-like HicB family nuclease